MTDGKSSSYDQTWRLVVNTSSTLNLESCNLCISCVLKKHIYILLVFQIFLPPKWGMYIDSLNRNPVKDSVIYKVPCFSLINSNMKRTV